MSFGPLGQSYGPDSPIASERIDLIKNGIEIESLLQIRNLLEIREINPAVMTRRSGVENEAYDEGTEKDCGRNEAKRGTVLINLGELGTSLQIVRLEIEKFEQNSLCLC